MELRIAGAILGRTLLDHDGGGSARRLLYVSQKSTGADDRGKCVVNLRAAK